MKKYLIVLFLLSLDLSFAQERNISGKVVDTTQTPVVYANIMAEALNAVDIPPVFAMTGENGKYSIRLLNKYAYQLTVLSMGYEKYIFRVDSLSGSFEKNIVLHPAKNQLDEVVITADIPVKVTQDSIVYKTDKFKTGEERKLKDVLKKLPGVEVSKTGQVTVMGKKVSKVLVEGKEFFGGGTKLAVENIPADAVDKVTAVDDYNSVSFMSGLTDEQKMIINIKLKEGKKRFVFGDIYAGAGNDEKYIGKANLFYYSPKTNLSYIGSLNNNGEAAMEISDFMRFEGSSMNFDKMRSSIQSFKNISSIIFQNQFVSKKIHFQAMQWQQDFGDKNEFNTYFIYNRDKQRAKQEEENNYLVTGAIENRTTSDAQLFKTGIGKIHYRRKQSIFNYFDIEVSGNWQEQETQTDIVSRLDTISHFIEKENNNDNYDFLLNLAWHKRFNKHHTFRLLSNSAFKKYFPGNLWRTDQAVLNPLLPMQNDNLYQVYQDFEREIKENYIELKHYWVIDNKQHIYTSLGNHFSDKRFTSVTYQKLTGGGINSFETAGFDNDLKLQLNDLFGGLQYKLKWGKVIVKTGLFGHWYTWNFKAREDRRKFNLLPELKIERKYNFAKKISFTYALKSSIPDILKYADRYSLLDFSSVAKGSAELENELYHQFSFVFNNYSFAKKHQYYLQLMYSKKLNPIKNKLVYDDIYTYRESTQIELAEHSFNARLFYKLDLRKIFFKLQPFFQYRQYRQNIQGNWREIKSFNQDYALTAGTYFQKYPNFDVGAHLSLYQTDYASLSTQSFQMAPFIKLEHDFLKNFILSADYEYRINYDTNDVRTDYQTAGFTLSYQKENNPWGFEITGKNLFNTPYLERFDYGPYIINKRRIYQQGLLLMFKVHYKL